MPLAFAVKPHDRNSRYHLSSWPKVVDSVGHWITGYGWYAFWTNSDTPRIYYTDSSKDEGGSTGKYWDPTRHIAALIMEHTQRFVWYENQWWYIGPGKGGASFGPAGFPAQPPQNPRCEMLARPADVVDGKLYFGHRLLQIGQQILVPEFQGLDLRLQVCDTGLSQFRIGFHVLNNRPVIEGKGAGNDPATHPPGVDRA